MTAQSPTQILSWFGIFRFFLHYLCVHICRTHCTSHVAKSSTGLHRNQLFHIVKADWMNRRVTRRPKACTGRWEGGKVGGAVCLEQNLHVLKRSNISWPSSFYFNVFQTGLFWYSKHWFVFHAFEGHAICSVVHATLHVKHTKNTLGITMHKHTSPVLPSVGEVFSRLHSPSTPP